MTKKTRIRIARIAAGAVIAAGASLTAAGVAAADTGEDCGLLGICVTPEPDPTEPEPEPTETEPTVIPTETEPTEPTTEPTEPTEDPEPTEPTEDPEPTDDPGNGNGNGNGNGTGNNTDPDGGSGESAQQQGSSSLTDTGDETASDTSAQGSGEELAETGAAQTTFLLIGAATMIAGGVGFRVLPRLVSGRGGAAA
ncbi:hypothetical protein [Streptomyces sp. P17]|uniref:hypothetical protein n=1 Tax=Streptomyces sp. P17 TaxID=3074716 RepID=UPI0028F43DEA|nr:hypothetical protein [Streptomyces sp. P17]MDT9701566.1 hypothetical protein [Streptomyces sp. P17]